MSFDLGAQIEYDATDREQELLGFGDGCTDPAIVGGKGASLARLARLGLRTPPGFVVPTGAFRRYAQRPLPASYADALKQRLRALCAATDGADTLLAVRSSAVHEDGGAASFAGLHTSVMPVAPADCEDAIRACWASLWDSAAVSYRTAHAQTDKAAMAVVVQQYVAADACAVVFTSEPVTTDPSRIVVNAAPCAGEGLVSGAVSAETIVFSRRDLAIVERHAGVIGGSSVAEIVPNDELVGLVVDCLEIEDEFGAAVDVESVWAGGEWQLVQARPVTA